MRRRSLLVAGLVLLATAGMARANEIETLFAPGVTGSFDNPRDAARMAEEFSRHDLLVDAGNAELRWQFTSRGVPFNDIFLRREITSPFTTIRVRLRNLGAPVVLAMKAPDAHGAEYTAARVEVPTSEEWRWIEFRAADLAIGSWSRDPDGRMDYPLSCFVLIAFDVKPALLYDIRIGRVDVVRPEPPRATYSLAGVPATLVHGRTYHATLRYQLSAPTLTDGVAIALRRAGRSVITCPVPNAPQPSVARFGRTSLTFPITIPEFAEGGHYEVVPEVGNARAVARGGRPLQATLVARQPGRVTAAVKIHNGTPTLHINGKPHSGMAYAAYGPSVEVFSDFARAGVDLYTFAATPTESGYGLSRTTWTAPGVYDYSQLDERVAMVLKANPNAYFFPRLYLHAPQWWSALHPDDLVTYDPGNGTAQPFLHPGGRPCPSWASQQWRADTIEGLKRLIRHIESSPYADRCIGYHIASGTTEEWMMWGANEEQWVDYSPANTGGFRRWLAARYGGDAELQAAWHRPGATVAGATIPTRQERAAAGLGSLHDPATEQRVIDFYTYNSQMVVETITTFAAAVKQATRRTKIVGAFYGYILQLCGEQRQQNAGHLALDRLVASPDVDFITSPTSYAFRQLGAAGTSHFMSLLGSIKLHGKLWFNENDVRTSLAPGQVGEWGRPPDVAGDIIQQDKELANAITNGTAQWWFDVGSNRYNDPKLMARIGHLRAAAARALSADRTPADQVAFAIDAMALAGMRVGDVMGAHLLISRLPDLHRIGRPVGHYLTTDLARLAGSRMVILPTSWAPDARQRTDVERLKGDGRVLVFSYLPGAMKDGVLDEAAMSAFTGMRLRLRQGPQPLVAAILGDSPLTVDLSGGRVGLERQVTPSCYIDDPGAEPLARFADGTVAVARKTMGGWTSVVTAVGDLPRAVLARLADLAGAHRYIETDDVVWAAAGLVSVCAREPGPLTIKLPRQATVVDAFTGQEVARKVTQFTTPFAANQTRLFRLER